MKQKDIWLTDLNPTTGSEIWGKRPVVIISGDAMNDHQNLKIVCPITSSIKQLMGCVVLQKNEQNGLEKDSEIVTWQVRAIDESRLIHKIGEVSDEQ